MGGGGLSGARESHTPILISAAGFVFALHLAGFPS